MEPCLFKWRTVALPCDAHPYGEHYCSLPVHYSTPHVCDCGVRR